nr:MAG TPA: hypothetical protein [Caudoviricetes sp.]
MLQESNTIRLYRTKKISLRNSGICIVLVLI